MTKVTNQTPTNATAKTAKTNVKGTATPTKLEAVKTIPPVSLEERKAKFKQFFTLQEKHDKLEATSLKLQELIDGNDPIDSDIVLCIKLGPESRYVSEFDFKTFNQQIIGEALSCINGKVDKMLEMLKEEILKVSL